ncbi:hypothetical protein DL93DRAFT_2165755 [Clavulina sp. PMI_390]|nr:hypothetical protein DL93DRAFT_2165755 [Clavulina sp. PMI_390]
MAGGSSRPLLSTVKNSRRSLLHRSVQPSNGANSFASSNARRSWSSSSPTCSRSSPLNPSSTVPAQRVAPTSFKSQSSSLSTITLSKTLSTSLPSSSSSIGAFTSSKPFSTSAAHASKPPAPAQTSEGDDGHWAIYYLWQTFPNLPTDFAPDVARRMLTHMSYRAGAQTYGHNARLSFLGRRVLQAYLLMHLQATVPDSVMLGPGAGQKGSVLNKPKEAGALDGFMDLEAIVESALETRSLGERVAPVWRLENGIRWTSALSPSKLPGHAAEQSYQRGRDKVMGTTVEAIIGGIFHQFGGLEAQYVFREHVLPYLELPRSLQPASEAQEVPFRIVKGVVDSATSNTPRRRTVA